MPSHARDAVVPKSVELEIRVARVELALQSILDTIDGLTTRVIALQAHLDHVSARLDRR